MSIFKRSTTEFIDEDISRRSVAATTTSQRTGRQRLTGAATLDIDRIEADPQHREQFDEESLSRLAESLRAHGQLQPIRVRWEESRGKYVIIAGERRFRAAQQAGLTTLDCVIAEGDLNDGRILREQIIENALREDLKPTEQAKAFRDLMESEGWSGRQLAAQIQVNQSTVSRTLKLLELPESIQQQVDAGELSMVDAIKLLKELPTETADDTATSESEDSPALRRSSRRSKKNRERKLVTSIGTLTLKSRRLMTDDLWIAALQEALAEAQGAGSLEEKRAA